MVVGAFLELLILISKLENPNKLLHLEISIISTLLLIEWRENI